MPTVDMDFGNLVPEEGEYDFRVNKVEVAVNKTSGNKFMNFTCELQGPTNVGDKIIQRLSLLPQSRIFLQQWLQGLTGDSWDQDGMSIDTDDLVGLEARGVLILQEYQGAMQAKFARCYQAEDGTPYPQAVAGQDIFDN